MTNPLPTARELEALKILWRRKQATVREIYEEMATEENGLAYTTVLSLVQTMEKKGLVSRESEGRGKTHTYSAQVQPDTTMRSLAGDFLDKVFDGAVSQYLVHALEARRPSAQELEELQQMIAAAKARRETSEPSSNEGNHE